MVDVICRHCYREAPQGAFLFAAACAVIENPYAGRYEPDLMPFMAELRSLGTLLAKKTLRSTVKPPSWV